MPLSMAVLSNSIESFSETEPQEAAICQVPRLTSETSKPVLPSLRYFMRSYSVAKLREWAIELVLRVFVPAEGLNEGSQVSRGRGIPVRKKNRFHHGGTHWTLARRDGPMAVRQVIAD